MTIYCFRFVSPLPEPLYDAGSVQLGEKTYLTVGGYNDNTGTSSGAIYEYNAENEAWILREESLEMERQLFGVVALPASQSAVN